MATILSILGMVSQLKNFFSSSGSDMVVPNYPVYPESNDVTGWLGVPFKK